MKNRNFPIVQKKTKKTHNRYFLHLTIPHNRPRALMQIIIEPIVILNKSILYKWKRTESPFSVLLYLPKRFRRLKWLFLETIYGECGMTNVKLIVEEVKKTWLLSIIIGTCRWKTSNYYYLNCAHESIEMKHFKFSIKMDK